MAEANQDDATLKLSLLESERSYDWNNFEIEKQIAAGGMGIVYKARHKTLDRQCAIKVLDRKNETDKSLQRFMNEMRLACSLDHPNIVKVYAAGFNDEKLPYLAMEWLEGQTLAEILSVKSKLSAQEFVVVFTQVIAAIEYAHQHKIIHRDLKPANIFLSERTDTGSFTVKLLDFGIARVIEGDGSDLKITQTGVLLGTPLYMSPEQSSGAVVDNRSDIYSLGAVMYEALSGSPPFQGENALEIIYKHSKQPVDVSKLARESSNSALNECVLKCLEKKAEDRFQSASELLDHFSKASKLLREPPKLAAKAKWLILPLPIIILALIVFIVIQQTASKKNAAPLKLTFVTEKLPARASMKELLLHGTAYIKKSNDAKRSGNIEKADHYKQLAMSAWMKCSEFAAHKKAILEDECNQFSKKYPRAKYPDDLQRRVDEAMNTGWNAEMKIGTLLELDYKLDDARKHYLKAIELNGSNHLLRSEATRFAARVLHFQGKNDEAIAEMRELLKVPAFPEHPEWDKIQDDYYWQNSTTALQLSELLRENNQIDEARKTLEKSKEYNQKVGKTIRLFREAEILIAEAAFEKDIAAKKKNFDRAYQILASCNAGGGFKNAQEECKACVACAHFFESVDKEKAIAEYYEAISIAQRATSGDSIAEVLRTSCGFANDVGEFDDVAEMIKKGKGNFSELQSGNFIGMTDGYPVDCEATFATAVSAFLKKDFELAISEFKKVPLLANSGRRITQRASWMLGRCYFALGNKKEALKYFESAMNESADHQFLLERNFLKNGKPEYDQLLKN